MSSLPVDPAQVLCDCWCLNAQRAARRLARLYDEGLRPFELSHGQFSLLMLVAGLGPASVGRLADELVMDRTTVTAALKPLERRGLLRSAASPDDARQRLARITPAGTALLARASAAWQQLQASVRRERPTAALRPALRQLAATRGPRRAPTPKGKASP
jgi:DNA-binding MarR family transcriptional regulator